MVINWVDNYWNQIFGKSDELTMGRLGLKKYKEKDNKMEIFKDKVKDKVWMVINIYLYFVLNLVLVHGFV